MWTFWGLGDDSYRHDDLMHVSDVRVADHMLITEMKPVAFVTICFCQYTTRLSRRNTPSRYP